MKGRVEGGNEIQKTSRGKKLLQFCPYDMKLAEAAEKNYVRDT